MTALPFPVAGLGTYYLLRGRVSNEAAALGAFAFTLSGPVLSTGNMLNYSWTVGLLPFVLLATERFVQQPAAVRLALAALCFALQALAGEVVTLAGTGAIAVIYATVTARNGTRSRLHAVLLATVAGAAGALLAAVQLFPLAAALLRSARGEGAVTDGWSVHPLSLVEVVMPNYFGDTFVPTKDVSNWIMPLNSGREPLLMSIYLGVPLLFVALLGIAAGSARRWTTFWALVALATFVLALGYYTPIYPFLRDAVPGMRTLRYPSKYFLFTTFAVASVAAVGWDAIVRGESIVGKRRKVVLAILCSFGVAGGALAALAVVLPRASFDMFARLGGLVGVNDVEWAAEIAVAAAAPQGMRLLGLSVAALGLYWILLRSPGLSLVARGGLFVLLVADLLLTNIPLNPTMPADLLRAPQWVAATREHPTDRVYIGRGERSVDELRIDSPPIMGVDPETPLRVVAALQSTLLCMMPSGPEVREPISRDMSSLRPVDYWVMSNEFHQPGRGAARGRYLARTATRYYLLGEAPLGDFRLVAEVPNLSPLAVYELTSVRPRAVVASSEFVEPDLVVHAFAMMSDQFDPSTEVLLTAAPPEPAGAVGVGVPAQAAILEEGTNHIVLRAGAPEGGGYLVLMDSYDPGWTAEVDGQDATVLKANGLFRAVRLASGEHVVRFEYRPVSLYVGAAVSLATALGLLLACWLARRRTMRA
jgi:hypothetical protein